MKNYLFELLGIAACVAELIWRPYPGILSLIIAGVIIGASAYLTYDGDKKMIDDMWWRMAISILAPLVIAIGGAQ